MQDEALAAFADHYDANNGRHDIVRMFALYAKIGPAMWEAIERDRTERARQVFSAFKPSR